MVTVALDALAFGVVIPVEPGLVMRLGHISAGDASFWLGAILTTFSTAQFAAAPVLGGLSDRFGRRPVLLASLAAQGLAALASAFAPNLFWFFLIRAAAGAGSGNTAAASAYLADISTPEQRARRFGWVGAMFGLGFVLGPAAGGLLGGVSVRLPFLVSAGLAGCNVLYGLAALPESLPADRRRPFRWGGANPFGALRGAFAGGGAWRLGFAWCCLWFALGAQQSSFILANQMRFHWNTRDNGLVLALAGIASAITQGLLVGRAQSRLGRRRTALAGLGCSALGYFFYAFAASRWIMFPGVLILALGALGNPSLQAIFSARAGSRRQGETQGALACLQGLMAIIAPLATGALFTVATRPGAALHFPGAPFLLAAIVCTAGGFVLIGAKED